MNVAARGCLLLTAVLALLRSGGSGARAEEPPAPAAPLLVAVLLDGQLQSGTLAGITATGVRLTDAAGKVVEHAGDALIEVRSRAAAPVTPTKPTGARLRATLVGGEVLVASTWGPASDGLWLASPSFGRLEIPFDLVRSLAPLPSAAGVCHDPEGRGDPVPGADLALLVSGDELQGTVIEAQQAGLVLEASGGRRRLLGWSDLLLARVDNACLAPRAGASAEIETHDGDVLRAGGAPTADAALTLAVPLASDPALVAQVPAGALSALRWRGGAIVDATALAFTSVYRPSLPWQPGSLAEAFTARERGARVGRRPLGCPLRLDGRAYTHGFAVHSGSTLTLPLDGGYRKFTALVGIDDEAKEEGRLHAEIEVPGDVDVRVLGDGKVLWEAKGLTGLVSARRVGPLDVSGVRELVLEVQEGGHLNWLDRVTWADPLLVR